MESSQRDELVRTVAERSATATLKRLRTDARKMNTAELRGYVRAHALACVCGEASQIMDDMQLSDVQVKSLIASALEQTVHLVVRSFTARPALTTPAPHVRLRIAA